MVLGRGDAGVGWGGSGLGSGLQRDTMEDLVQRHPRMIPLPLPLPCSWDPQGKAASTERSLRTQCARLGASPICPGPWGWATSTAAKPLRASEV